MKNKVAQPDLADILRLSNQAIISWKLDGTVTGWNPCAERLFGYAAQEIIDQSISQIAMPGDADQLILITERVGQGETVQDIETRLRKKDGRSVDVSLTLSPIRDKN